MTISTFSVPVDIPWRRIAFSEDMHDKTACDREGPLRWRSSLAVFSYQPPDDQQQMEGQLISYLKVACTITGFQPDGQEVDIRNRLGRSGWTSKKVADNIADSISAYFACYGAVLEVVVAPKHREGVSIANYPYFADFDPKKRELYEAVTDTGEVMSRSLEDVNVRLGQTTLQSHEVKDTTGLSLEVSGTYGSKQASNVSGSAGYTNQTQTTDLTQQQYDNVRTTDSAREARETQSHTTQLSQMYHQLDSYHLGTNRALFMLLPRPHVIESPRTFVNGPREIEGVQEFMLVVIRPKAIEEMCVEAYLETAHLVRTAIVDYPTNVATLMLPRITADVEDRDGGLFDGDDDSYANYQTGSATYAVPSDSELDTTTVADGYKIENVNKTGDADFTVEAAPDHVTIKGWANGRFVDNKTGNDLFNASLEVTASIFTRKKIGVVTGYDNALMITGRGVCSCSAFDDYLGHSVLFEKGLSLTQSLASGSRERPAMTISDANQVQRAIGRELVQSFASPHRYPRGKLGLLDTQLVAASTGAMISRADKSLNFPITEAPEIDREVLAKIRRASPRMTRARLLQMPLSEQMSAFDISIDEALATRRALMDLDRSSREPDERPQILVPDLYGLQLEEGRAALAPLRLAFGGSEVIDSALPTGVIVGQEPAAGSSASAATPVSLKIASGLSVRIPEIVGLGLGEALCRIREAGLLSEPVIHGELGPGITVRESKPAPRHWVVPHARMTVTVAAD